jgi:hypothetical protein
MPTPNATPTPGWYPDPYDPETTRYWDGSKWTENRSQLRTGKEQKADGVIVVGYILAVLMPLIGFIIGLTQINKNRHGLWVVVVSIAAFLIYLLLIAGAASTPNGRGY